LATRILAGDRSPCPTPTVWRVQATRNGITDARYWCDQHLPDDDRPKDAPMTGNATPASQPPMNYLEAAHRLMLAVHDRDSTAVLALWNHLDDRQRLDLAVSTATGNLELIRHQLGDATPDALGEYLRTQLRGMVIEPQSGSS